MTVKVTDNGYAEMMKSIGDSNKELQVGIIDDSQYQNGMSVSEVAMIQEYGLGVPQRSWLRDYIDSLGNLTPEFTQIGKQIFDGKISAEKALDSWGKSMVNGIKKRISQGIQPENAPETIEQKGSSTPLIDTKRFFNHISHKVSDVR